MRRGPIETESDAAAPAGGPPVLGSGAEIDTTGCEPCTKEVERAAKGGSNSPENLRLLCAAHNRLEAGRAYGKDPLDKFYGGP